MMTDRDVLDLRGATRRLKEFRRRSHVVLWWDPAGDVEAWTRERTAEAQRWIWLQAELVRPSPPHDLAPGIHLVSRWGELIASLPPSPWSTDVLEDELLRWEARDSCGR